MAQNSYNVVTNPNGTFTIEGLQQICSLDGQSVQLVVEGISNGSNVITQPILAYAAPSDGTEQALISPQIISLSNPVASHQIDRQSVYIIQTNETPVQQGILEKAIDTGSKDQLSVCYTQAQTNWVQTKSSDTFELLIKKDSTPTKTIPTITVRNQQVVTAQTAAPNVVVQGGKDNKPAKLVPLTKRHTIGGPPVGILKTTLQSQNVHAGKVNKMRRNSNVAANSTISATSSRTTTGVNTVHLASPSRGGQTRTPIHSETSPRSVAVNVKPTQSVEIGSLSERIKQANLKQRTQQQAQLQPKVQPQQQIQVQQQQSKAQQQQQVPVHQQQSKAQQQIQVQQQQSKTQQQQQQIQVQQQQSKAQQQQQQIQQQQLKFHQQQQQLLKLQQQQQLKAQQQQTNTVQRQQASANRQVQTSQTPNQRQRAMGQVFSGNRQQQQTPLSQQQRQHLMQQQQQLLQQQKQQQQILQQQLLARQQADRQKLQAAMQVAMNENVEQPMEVDSSEVTENQNSSRKADPEESAIESFAYLQQEIEDPQSSIVQHAVVGNEAKMLVILENGEQRLITFEVPKEECTVQDLLEQANIYPSQDPRVSLVSDPALNINYIVEIAPKEEQAESDTTQVAQAEVKTPMKNNTGQTTVAQAQTSPRVPKYKRGMLAVCSFCGMSAADFNYCMRCKRKLPENVKAIPISPAKKESGLSTDSFYKKNESTLSQKLEREAVAKRGRGRGRGMVRTKQTKEPECLTISSDEEDENRRHKRLNDSKESITTQTSTNNEETERVIEKEPIITNNPVSAVLPSTQNTESGEGSPTNPASNLSTYLTCRTVRIGSYKYVPKDKIHISSAGLRLEVPLLEDDKNSIAIDIKYTDLVTVLMHFSKSMPVLFFYANVALGLKIREILGMQDPKGPYYDPASKDQTHKRITLLPEKLSEDSKAVLKELYRLKYDELNPKEANDILVIASPKSTNAQPAPKKSASSNSTTNGVIQTITVYPPPPAKGGIAINTEDFICLAEDQFLNDVIIDFYLKYLMLEVLSATDSRRTHVFSSYFYKRLTSPHTHPTENSEKLSAAAKRHTRVQKWTKNVNIFEKDFIVIPINEHAHWFLAIICFPGLVGKVAPKVEAKSENQKIADKKKKNAKLDSLKISSATVTSVSTITIENDDGSERDEAEGDEEEMETDSDEDEESEANKNAEKTEVKPECQTPEKKDVVKVPCILIFDSLAGASRARVVATLRDYLSCEYQKKMGAEQIFSKDTIKGACPKVPQQSNFTDCGLYVLQYVESFFKDPIVDYTLPIKTLKTWFEEIIVTRKREELAKLLTKLVHNTKGNKTINLPTLSFPTQDGKLRTKQEAEAKTKPEVENKKKATETTDSKSNTSTSALENPENSSSSDSASKDSTSQQTIPQSQSQAVSTTEGNLAVHKEVVTTTLTRSSAETLAILKNKRIPRLQKTSECQEDKQVAKKHKGESFDSCK